MDTPRTETPKRVAVYMSNREGVPEALLEFSAVRKVYARDYARMAQLSGNRMSSDNFSTNVNSTFVQAGPTIFVLQTTGMGSNTRGI